MKQIKEPTVFRDTGEWTAWLTGDNAPYDKTYGYSYHNDGHIVFNVPRGIILCAPYFGATELYLSYLSAGSVNTATQISRKAKEAVLAYIDWKYYQKKRSISRGEANDWENKYYNQLRLTPIGDTTIEYITSAGVDTTVFTRL